jgi:hypothetical protein
MISSRREMLFTTTAQRARRLKHILFVVSVVPSWFNQAFPIKRDG